MATSTTNLSKKVLYQTLTAPTNGYLLIQMNASGINNIVDIEFQQSIDGENWDTIKDYNSNKIRFRLGANRKSADSAVELIDPFWAQHLRAKILSESSAGSLEFITP
jgi:hypothetical protein